MKVYLVLDSVDYEGTTVLSVVDSIEKAIEKIRLVATTSGKTDLQVEGDGLSFEIRDNNTERTWCLSERTVH